MADTQMNANQTMHCDKRKHDGCDIRQTINKSKMSYMFISKYRSVGENAAPLYQLVGTIMGECSPSKKNKMKNAD